MTQPVHLLIDGDVVAFRAASAVQYVEEDMHGVTTHQAEVADGETAVDQIMAKIITKVAPEAYAEGLVTYEVYLSDKSNWRYRVYADYKSNRKDSIRPLILSQMRDYMRTKYAAVHYDDLEADDVIGIMLTKPRKLSYLEMTFKEHTKVIAVGRDKDFLSIPGWHYQLNQDDAQGRPIVFEVTQEQADFWHLRQALSGDAVDGYAGCPGMGGKRAEEALKLGLVLYPEYSKITRGPNKGKDTVRWIGRPKTPEETQWDVVVSCFAKSHCDEMEALTMARLARILRWGEYNLETAEVTLWTPPK